MSGIDIDLIDSTIPITINNTIEGSTGDDFLNGTDGNDILMGGLGNDTLIGGRGNDVLLFNLGDGHDTIDNLSTDNQSTIDILQFGVGIRPENIEFHRIVNSLDSDLRIKGTTDAITIKNYFANHGIYNNAYIYFADGTIWTPLQMYNMVGIRDGDEMNNSLVGGTRDDILHGQGGNDLLSGGIGADTMEGGAGDDVYIVDNMKDVVSEAIDSTNLVLVRKGDVWADDFPLSTLSANGSKVAFASNDDSIVANDTNYTQGVFIQDLMTGVLIRVSTDANGVQANGYSSSATLSADGNKVIFTSKATNLVDGDTNGVADIFVKNLRSGGVTRVSTDGNGVQANRESRFATLSADGNKVAFQSAATNLVAEGGYHDIYIKDLNTGVITYSDVNSWFSFPLSADGSKLAFISYLDNLVADDTNGVADVFVKDLNTGVIIRINTDVNGVQANSGVIYADISLSADGKKVAFRSDASNLVAGDNYGSSIFIKDINTGAIERISNDTIRDSSKPRLSADGSKLAFISNVYDFTDPIPPELLSDVFVKDLNTGVITRVTTGAKSWTSAMSPPPLDIALSADGSTVAFASDADNLGVGGFDYKTDVFIKNISSAIDAGGVDAVQSSVSYSLLFTSYIENLTLTGTANIDAMGNTLNNILISNSGNNLLRGNLGNDTYIFGTAFGQDTVDDTSNKVELNTINLSAYNASQLVFSHTGNDYVIAVKETNDTVTIKNALSVNNRATYNLILATETLSYQQLIQNANTAPLGQASAVLVDGLEDTPYTLYANDLLQGFSDVEANTLSITGLMADHATITLNSDGGFTLKPAENYYGVIQLHYQVSDSLGGSVSASQHINIEKFITIGSTGSDQLRGDTGNDIFIVNHVRDVVFEEASGGIDTVQSTLSHILRDNVENLILVGDTDLSGTGNNANNNLTGNNGNNRLLAGNGNDTLSGGAGGDTLNGGAGADVMYGGTGNDTFTVENTSDTVTEFADEGFDTVNSFISYTLTAHVERLILEGTESLNGFGNDLDNTLNGNNANNWLVGGLGNDTLQGKGGVDSLEGGMGSDLYYVDNAGDIVAELANEGTDKVSSSISYTLTANVEQLFLTGIADLAGTGNALNNVIYGNGGDNLLNGATGNDSLNGSLGDDALDGGQGNDTLVGGLGNDTYFLSAQSGQDSIDNKDSVGNDILALASGLSAEQVWLRQLGDDLEISIIGTANSVKIEGWYNGSTANQLDSLRLSEGNTLLFSEVQTLVDAMAVFSPPPLGQANLTSEQKAILGTTIAIAWEVVS